MLGLTLAIVASLSLSAQASPTFHSSEIRSNLTTSLAELALQKVLSDAAPVFGYYTNNRTHTAQWMKWYPDSTKLVHMNLPGAHDPQTWNYTLATQEALDHVTNLDGEIMFPPKFFQCQESPIISMLNSGIRVFDIRYAFDPTNSTLVYWHSQALMSETATVDDTLFGFYKWLDDHPTETLLLSFQYEGSTTIHAQDDAAVQLALFNALTSPAAQKYILQTKDELGTLGDARGKITLLRRFDFDQLPASYTDAIPGLHFSPSLWTDDDPDITLVYNTEKNLTVYIEDYYETDSAIGTTAAYNIGLKYNATTAHLIKAATQYPDSLFWTFASSEYNLNVPADTPKIMALGNGTELTPLGGVNQQLVTFLQQQKGKRLGILMFDFFDTPSNLVQTFLDL
jgi:1-phosphatidylinositol phosphodiesterase